MLIYFLLPLIAVALLCVPFIFTAKKIKNGRSPKGAFIGNLCTFAGIMLCALIVPVGNFVSAASEEGVKATSSILSVSLFHSAQAVISARSLLTSFANICKTEGSNTILLIHCAVIRSV